MPRMPSKLLQQENEAAAVVQLLRRLFKGVHVYSKAVLKRTGLSGPQIWALTIIAAEPGLSLRELAGRMFAHPSTVSGVVERLVQRNALERRTDPEDRRGIKLSLTPAGQRLLKRSPPPVQVGLRRALLRMAAPELRQLRLNLEAIAHETEVTGVEAPFFDIP